MTAPTQQQLAKALGVDPALVTRYKRRGMPVDSVEAAQAWKTANVQARVGGRQGKGAEASAPITEPQQPDSGPAGPGYNDHRARREKAEADRAEVLAVREREQALLREPAERAFFDAFRGMRDAAFQAMRDAAPKVRDVSEVREISLILEAELRQALQAFETKTTARLAELAREARP